MFVEVKLWTRDANNCCSGRIVATEHRICILFRELRLKNVDTTHLLSMVAANAMKRMRMSLKFPKNPPRSRGLRNTGVSLVGSTIIGYHSWKLSIFPTTYFWQFSTGFWLPSLGTCRTRFTTLCLFSDKLSSEVSDLNILAFPLKSRSIVT